MNAYLILSDDHLSSQTCSQGDCPYAPDSLSLRATVGRASVYTTAQTTLFQLPNGAAVIGELYARDRISKEQLHRRLASLPTGSIRRWVLNECWGDYVLLLPDAKDGSFSITRSPTPACDLQCIYAQHAGKHFVTSHITLAETHGLYRRRVDFDHIAHQLLYPGLKTESTGLADVRELLPGCTLYVRSRNRQIGLSWNPWLYVDGAHRTTDVNEAARAIRSSIEDVVQSWLEGDGPVLLELSGGLDSSIVGASLCHSTTPVTCLTLTTQVPGADEREYAALVADMLGVELQSAELLLEDAAYRFPLPGDAVTPAIGPLQHAIDKTIHRFANSTGARSLFTGAGGDSVFCYITNANPAADAFRGAGTSAAINAIRDISSFHQCTYWKAARLTLKKLISNSALHPKDSSFVRSGSMQLEPCPHPWLAHPDDALAGDRQRIFELSSTQFFRETCPRSVDRKMRMPLLSQPVIEACLRVPSWMWFRGGQNRAVARFAFSDVLPAKISSRKSKGTFTAYLGAFYRRHISEMIRFVSEGELSSRGFIDVDSLRALGSHEMPRGGNAFMRVFQLCILENWARHQVLRGDSSLTRGVH